MMLTTAQRDTIESVVSVFETGRLPGPDAYATTALLADGAGISYGIHQATAASGSLVAVVRTYYGLGGGLGDWTVDEALRGVLMSVGRSPELVPPRVLETMSRLREAGEDSRMVAAQNQVFEVQYWAPALRQCAELRLTLPLSALALYDLAIHSGLGRLAMLRRQFPEMPPSKGGAEQMWTSALVLARHRWLLGNAREVVRRTAYRTQALRDLMAEDRWSLCPPLVVRGVRVA
jgi:hypothetical protein